MVIMQKLAKQALKDNTDAGITVIFEPVAQNTVIRPMAEAVCIVQGGQPVRYIDTADHQEKDITISDLHGLILQSNAEACKKRLDGYEMALTAKKIPIRIRVDVNDVHIFVCRKTTVKQAMADFYKKITAHQYE